MDENLKKIEELEARISRVEGRLGISTETGLSSSPKESREDLLVPESYSGIQPSPPLQRPPSPPPPQKEWWEGMPREGRASTGETKNIESYIGRWILGIIGIVAIIFGVSFFFKYAFENNLIGPAGRVALGVLGGLTFIVLGELLRSRYEKYSYILSGGGLGLFYLSIYGAFHFYHIINSTTAFGFMGVVTAFGVILSLWTGAIELAALALSGGFLTPYLLSTGVPNDLGFFAYLLVLNLGILSVAFFKKWHALTLLGFTGTVLNFASWYSAYYETEKIFFAVFTLAIFYAIYALAGVVANIATGKESDQGDLFILSINPAWFFGWCYYLLQPKYEYSLGFLAAGLGAFYIFFSYLALTLRSEDKKLTLFLSGIAVIFLTIAIPLQLKQNAITIAWAAEAAVLFFLGFYLKNQVMRMLAAGVFMIALVRLFAWDSGAGDLSKFLPVFNKRFFTYFMVTLASSIMTYLAWFGRAMLTKEEKGVLPILGTSVNVLVIAAITLELYSFFDARIFELERKNILELKRKTPVVESGRIYPPAYEYEARYQVRSSTAYKSITNQRNASISVFWTIYAIFLITVGILYRSAFIRWSALAFFGVTIAKVFIIDLTALPTPYRIISFTVLGIILLIASYFYFRYQKSLEAPRV